MLSMKVVSMCRSIYFYHCNYGLIINLRIKMQIKKWWSEVDLNHRHKPFQGSALPTELSDHAQSFSIIYLNNQRKTKLNLLILAN